MREKQLSGFHHVFFLVLSLLVAACGNTSDEWVIESNSTKTVNETTHLSKLTVGENADLIAPDGYRLTLTVNGVETGQVLKTWEGRDYKFAPHTYQGDIVLTVTEANDVFWSMGRELGMREGGETGNARGTQDRSDSLYPFRQALYLDADGIDDAKSVLAAVQGEKPSGFTIQNIKIESKGSFYEDPTSPGGTGFNGIYVAGGEYHIRGLEINFYGDGRSDFAAQGAAVVSENEGTRLVLENADIETQGIVRSAVIAKSGSDMIVKDSMITARGGVLPPGWYSPMSPPQMRSTLWISGLIVATSTALSWGIQYWTSRGIAVLDVNYGGSSGYGRAYRQRLNGQWGVVDVDDCVNGARHLVKIGEVDGNRLAIRGGQRGWIHNALRAHVP